MIESGRVPRKGRIRAITEKLSERVPENAKIRVSTGKRENQAKSRENVESVQEQKSCPNEYRKMVESGSVPENDTIRPSPGKT